MPEQTAPPAAQTGPDPGDSLEMVDLADGFVRLTMRVRLTRERAYAVIEAMQDGHA